MEGTPVWLAFLAGASLSLLQDGQKFSHGCFHQHGNDCHGGTFPCLPLSAAPSFPALSPSLPSLQDSCVCNAEGLQHKSLALPARRSTSFRVRTCQVAATGWFCQGREGDNPTRSKRLISQAWEPDWNTHPPRTDTARCLEPGRAVCRRSSGTAGICG